MVPLFREKEIGMLKNQFASMQVVFVTSACHLFLRESEVALWLSKRNQRTEHEFQLQLQYVQLTLRGFSHPSTVPSSGILTKTIVTDMAQQIIDQERERESYYLSDNSYEDH